MYAYAPNGIVTDLVAEIPDYHAELKEEYRKVPASAPAGLALGWTFDGKSYVAPAPFQPAPGPAAPVITFKADIYRRCNEAEAEMIDAALAGASVRERRLFEFAQYLDHADPIFKTMHDAMVGMFGEDRTAILLAVS